mmetsp:Transcript_13221/g.32454  ORF Transcript_13221/g.32454 Transcript_13221/m.32454 type:complete len:90 (+) Transcript_13221:288-557(+)
MYAHISSPKDLLLSGMDSLLCYLKKLASNEHSSHFARSSTNFIEFCIAQETARWIFINVSISAEGLNGFESNLGGLFGTIEDDSCAILS